MTRAERLTQIRALQAEGLTHWQIAERLGISRSHVSHVASDHSYHTTLRLSREAKRRRTGTCSDCGGPTRYSGKAPSQRCKRCADAYYPAVYSAAQRGRGPTVEAVLVYLTEPRRYSDIRDHLAITSGHASKLLNRLVRYGLVRRISRGVYERVTA